MIYNTAQISLEICRRLHIDTHGKTSGHVMCNHGSHGVKSPCLSIDLDKGIGNCFSCGWHGTLRSLYFEETGHGILKDLGLKQEDVFFEPRDEVPVTDFNDPPEVGFEFNGKTVPCESTPAGKQFLQKRGFDRKISQKYRMKFVISGITRSILDPEDKDYHINFKNRVIIPIYEANHIISLEGRDVFGEEQWRKDLTKAGLNPDNHVYKKVLYPKLSSTNSLFELNKLDVAKPLYIVEGLMDLIALQTGSAFENSTCYFGAQITQRQMFLLDRFSKITIIPDYDKDGLTTCRKLYESKLMNKVEVLWPPSGYKDINEILQRPDKVKSLDDAVNRNWLTKATPLKDLSFDFYSKELC